MSKFRKALSLITAFILTLVTLVPITATPVMAQATTGSLTGTVKDQTGAAVAGATVTVTNQDTGETANPFTTSGEGFYRVSNLRPGRYSVTVEAAGFKKSVTTDVDVKVGTDNPLDPSLEAGQVTETVTVVAGGEEVAQTTSQISSSFETRKVEELPSNAAGGGIDTLALLAPGVVPGFGNVNSNGTTLSVNGNRARANNFTLDGTDNNDLTIGGPNFFISNSDSVQEFQVITTNYSAQYGRNQGAIVNIVTKSGTNEFHGSAFEYHRNSSALDAMTNLQRADPSRGKRDKFISNVFGGTFGGPVKKDKVFFFVDGQLIRQREGFQFQSGNPAITRAGLATLSAAFPGNAAIQALVNQNVFAIQPDARPRADRAGGTLCFPRDPTLACTGANAVVVPTAFAEYPLPLPYDQKEYGLRGDFNVTSRDSFNVKYRYQQSPETGNVGQSNGFGGDVPFSSRNLNGAYTRQIGSRGVNEFRAAFQKLSLIFGGCGAHPGGDDPLKGCIPDASQIGNAFTNITFTGISSAGATMQQLGPATNLPQGREVRVIQLADNFSWTAGQHSLILGIDYRNLDNSIPFLPNINGAFRFNSTARLVANAPNFVTLGAGEPRITYKETDQFYFFQDDWKVRDNLTLNLGIRYEYTGQPINLLNEISVERESDPSTALWRQSLPIEARTVPFIEPDKNNFAPRIGFAWSPRFGDGSVSRMLFGESDATVIRGGFSIAYEPAFYNIALNVSTAAPMVFLNTINNNASLTAPLFRLPSNPTGETVRTSLGSFLQRNTFDPRLLTQTQVGEDFHSPFSRQWSLGVQRQVNRNNVFEIRYVGNQGKDLFQTVNRNPDIGTLFRGFTSSGFGGTTFTFPGFPGLIPSGITPLVCVNNPATPDNEAACNNRIVAGRGLIRSRENTGSSSYHALQTRYNGRLWDQLTLGLSYTWSKTMDNASEIFAFGENAIASNPFDLQDNEQGLSGNDRPHAHSMNFLWDVPFFKKQEGFAGHVLGGWQLNGTYVLASGRPFTPSQFFNSLGLPTYQDFTFGATFFGFDNVRPFTGNPNAPRGAVGITDVDASYFGFMDFTPSPTGFYSLNELNSTGNAVAVSPNDVRFIFNGPGAAARFGNPFGNVGRNSERGPALNQLNLGIFKNTNITERVKVQFRAELFNALNHPNPGYGVAVQSSLPDTFVDDAGVPGSRFHDKRDMELSSRRVQFGIRIIF
jgi:outer membrane receptor protein involved in Fe transport